MATLFKIAMVLVLAAIGILSMCTVAAGAYVVTGGFATVRVDTPDTDVAIPVPMRILDIGLGIAAMASPSSDQLARDLNLEREQIDELRPMLRELSNEVSSMPDGELFRLVSPTEEIVISQRGGRFRIRVDTEEADVDLSVPRRAAGRVLDRLADL